MIRPRSRTNRRKNSNGGGIANSIYTFFSNFRLGGQIFHRKVYVFISAVVFTALIFYMCFLLFNVYTIDFKQLEGDVFEELDWDGERELSFLLLGGDPSDEEGYVFLDFIMLVVLKPSLGNVHLINISPALSPYSQKDKILKNSYTYGKDKEDGLKELVRGVEKLTTVDLDGYVYVTKERMQDILLQRGGLGVSAPSNLSDPDLEKPLKISSGHNSINYEDIVLFMSADENGSDDKMARQLSLVQELFGQVGFFDLILNLDLLQKSIDAIKNNIYTNFKIEDFVDIAYYLKFTSNLEYKTSFIKKSSVVVRREYYGERWIPVYETVDYDIRTSFVDNQVKFEQATVDIFNTTSVSGLAGDRARWIENRGIRVILTGNYSEMTKNNHIYVREPDKFKNTIKEIKSILRGKTIILEDEYEGRSAGDIIILLGESETL